MKQFIVTLDIDLADDRVAIRKFLRNLSLFLGVQSTDLQRVHVHRGCTLIHGFAVSPAVDRFFYYYQHASAASHPELVSFRKFLERWRILRVQVHEPTRREEGVSPQPREEACAIVFVHGWGGSAESTFGRFPEFTTRATGVSTYVYQYPSHWLRDSPSLAFVSRNLDNWIRLRTTAHRVAVVGHSLGGVASRYLAVIQECRKVKLGVRLVVLAASPTGGALLASIAASIPALRSAQLEELRPDSGFLVDLNERWTHWRETYTPHHARIGTMYGLNDSVVNHTSAIGDDPAAVPLFGVDHTSIVKPTSPDDEAVVTLLRFCREAGIGEPGTATR